MERFEGEDRMKRKTPVMSRGGTAGRGSTLGQTGCRPR